MTKFTCISMAYCIFICMYLFIFSEISPAFVQFKHIKLPPFLFNMSFYNTFQVLKSERLYKYRANHAIMNPAPEKVLHGCYGNGLELRRSQPKSLWCSKQLLVAITNHSLQSVCLIIGSQSCILNRSLVNSKFGELLAAERSIQLSLFIFFSLFPVLLP